MQVTGHNNWDEVMRQIKILNSFQVAIGFFGESNSRLLTIVKANEYGADIRPKKQWLAIPTKEVPLDADGIAKSAKEIDGLFRPKDKNVLCKMKGGKPVIYYYLAKHVKIPARPFIRTALADNKAKYERMVDTGLDKIMNGEMTAKQLLNRLGLVCVSDIQRSAIKWTKPPNADLTVKLKKKQSNDPLIDTGKMIAECTYKIIPS